MAYLGAYRLFAPPFTSARVQSRFEFVKLGGDMWSNCQRKGQAEIGISGWYQLVRSGWYQLVPRTIQVREYRVCRVTRGSPVQYVWIYECVCTLCDVRMAHTPYFHLHSPLLASKAVLTSWRLFVICGLIARGKFKPELEFQADTSSYFQVGTSSYHALYKYENIGYVEVPEDHLYNTYEYMNAYVLWRFMTYLCRIWYLGAFMYYTWYMHIFVDVFFCFFAVVQLFIAHTPP